MKHFLLSISLVMAVFALNGQILLIDELGIFIEPIHPTDTSLSTSPVLDSMNVHLIFEIPDSSGMFKFDVQILDSLGTFTLVSQTNLYPDSLGNNSNVFTYPEKVKYKVFVDKILYQDIRALVSVKDSLGYTLFSINGKSF